MSETWRIRGIVQARVPFAGMHEVVDEEQITVGYFLRIEDAQRSAAAPELDDALAHLIDLHEHEEGMPRTPEHAVVLEKARAALAKAQGES